MVLQMTFLCRGLHNVCVRKSRVVYRDKCVFKWSFFIAVHCLWQVKFVFTRNVYPFLFWNSNPIAILKCILSSVDVLKVVSIVSDGLRKNSIVFVSLRVFSTAYSVEDCIRTDRVVFISREVFLVGHSICVSSWSPAVISISMEVFHASKRRGCLAASTIGVVWSFEMILGIPFTPTVRGCTVIRKIRNEPYDSSRNLLYFSE